LLRNRYPAQNFGADGRHKVEWNEQIILSKDARWPISCVHDMLLVYGSIFDAFNDGCQKVKDANCRLDDDTDDALVEA
jgi:hypothetical protein